MINVTAAILVKNRKILIAKRKSNDKLSGKWEFPGGKVEADETPRACLAREMQEEFGIAVTVEEFLGESIYHYDHGSIRLLAYRAGWSHGDLNLMDHADCAWASIDQLNHFDFAPADIPFVNKLLSGEIRI
jgi:8-oxo-dGTP diphosphatase